MPDFTPKTTALSDTATRTGVLDLWRHLHGDRQDLLCVESAFLRKGELVNWAEAYFGPDQLEDAAAWVASQDQRGRECYFAVAQVFAPRRLSENAAPTRALHADMDGVPLEACPIRPTAVVETSPDHYHAYWVLDRLIQPSKAEDLNRRMARAIGADKAATDAVRLMRVPTTHHRKRPGAWADVKLLYVDEHRRVECAELERVLPKLAERPERDTRATPARLSDDDSELIAQLGRTSPIAGRLFDGDTSDYAHDGAVDESDADWGLVQELLRATGGDQERTYRLMRQSGLERSRWDDRRPGGDLLAYTIARAAERPSSAPSPRIQDSQNATPYRSDCDEHCRALHHPREQSLLLQAQAVNQILQLNLAPHLKVIILWFMVLVGVNRGQKFTASAEGVSQKIHISAQVVRGFVHATSRYDLTKKHLLPSDALNNELGLFDLDSTRAPEAGEFARMFEFTPLTGPGYVDYAQAVIERAPELLPVLRKRTRQRHESVELPPEIVQIPSCPGHFMNSTEEQTDVVCASCGEDFVQIVRTETRYIRAQNATPYRSERPAPRVGISGDTPHRFEPASADVERLLRIYERGAS